jgi:ligand-binding SRPBCC domain-containing protein
MAIPGIGTETTINLNPRYKNIYPGVEIERSEKASTLSPDFSELKNRPKSVPFEMNDISLNTEKTELLRGKNMKFNITSQVNRDYEQVFAGFSQKELFLKLSPPYLKLNLLRLDGSQKGDQIHVELLLPGSKQLWISQVTESGKKENELYFIDEGIKLPFFLKTWQHKHRVINKNGKAEIIDEISYKSPSALMDYLLYPVLKHQFAYRKKAYQEYFNK